MTINDQLVKRFDDNLASVLSLSMDFLKIIKFNRQDPQQLFSICLYARLVEIAFGCKALIESNALVGIPILLRSMFEADIDLSNSLKCRDYYKRMYASFLEQKLRLTKEALSSRNNPYLNAVKEQRIPADDLKKTKAEFDNLSGEGYSPISIRCRAELADRLNEYLSIYNMLCLDTHNSIQSLEEWHLEVNNSIDYHSVVFKKTKVDLLHYLSAIPGIILFQTKALAEFLKTDGIVFDKYFEEQNATSASGEGTCSRELGKLVCLYLSQ